MNETEQKSKEIQDEKPDDDTNESAGILVDDFLQISDPNTGKVYVSKRGNS